MKRQVFRIGNNLCFWNPLFSHTRKLSTIFNPLLQNVLRREVSQSEKIHVQIGNKKIGDVKRSQQVIGKNKLELSPEEVETIRENRKIREYFQNSKFVGSCGNYEAISETHSKNYPEVAFIGRSNCGKSSLINALLNQKISKTSKTPGHTKTLNFFEISNQIMLVDMPGYGFRCREDWGKLIQSYLTNRKQLRRVCLLIDSRRGVLKSDQEMVQMLDQIGISYQVILTKCDKESNPQILTQTQQFIQTSTIACYPETMLVSSTKKTNIRLLQKTILDVCGIKNLDQID